MAKVGDTSVLGFTAPFPETPAQTDGEHESGNLIVYQIQEDAAGNETNRYNVFNNDGDESINTGLWTLFDSVDHTTSFRQASHSVPAEH